MILILFAGPSTGLQLPQEVRITSGSELPWVHIVEHWCSKSMLKGFPSQLNGFVNMCPTFCLETQKQWNRQCSFHVYT